MSLTKEEVDWVAHLARLELDEDTSARMAKQLSGVLDYIAKLNEVDTTGVEPLSHSGGLTNVFREDAPAPSLPREQALQNAPDQSDGCFRVPRVIE